MPTEERAIDAIANPKGDGIARISEHEDGPWNPSVEYAKKQIKSLNDAGFVIVSRKVVQWAMDITDNAALYDALKTALTDTEATS